MNNKLLMLITCFVLVSCTPIKQNLPQQSVKPYRDTNAYAHGNWVLLIQSSSKDWYYDPKTLSKDDDGIVSFQSYWAPKSVAVDIVNTPTNKEGMLTALTQESKKDFGEDGDMAFDPKAYGPYLQQIDCATHAHASQSLIDGSCDLSEAPPESKNSVKADFVDCWRKVKPKTAIAFIENRICGRKFPMEVVRNYFLFQDEASPLPINQANLAAPQFYEVINNEYIVLDSKKNVREMRLSTFLLDKNLTPGHNYLYRANCGEKVDSLSVLGKAVDGFKPVGDPKSLSGVAYNRLCGDHGTYMTLVKSYTH